MTKVVGICPSQLGIFWPLASKQIDRANNVTETGYSLDDLKQKIADGKNQLWLINNGMAAAITAIMEYPLHRAIKVTYLGGDGMDEWLADFVEVELEVVKVCSDKDPDRVRQREDSVKAPLPWQ